MNYLLAGFLQALCMRAAKSMTGYTEVIQALLSISLIASFCAYCQRQSGARKKEPRVNSGSLLNGALSLGPLIVYQYSEA